MANPNFPNNPGYNLYVGARYIPIFDGEWDPEKKYEPLTIVQYKGDSYTSKTFVAAGIEPTNSVYWALTGKYNAQIEDLRDEIQANTQAIQKNAEDIQGTNANLDGVDERTQANTASIGNINDSIGTINQAISNLRAKTSGKQIIITDSFGTSISGVVTKPFTSWIKEWLPDTIISAKAGAGFCNDEFYNQLAALEDNPSVKDIFICGGWNDNPENAWATEANLIEKASTLKNYAVAHFPNAKLHCLFISSGMNSPKLPKLATCYTWYFRNMAAIGFEFSAWPSFAIAAGDYFVENQTHPNNAGAKVLAYAVANEMLGTSLPHALTGMGQINGKDPYSGTLNLPSQRTGLVVTSRGNPTGVSFTGPGQIGQNGQEEEIGTFKNANTRNSGDLHVPTLIITGETMFPTWLRVTTENVVKLVMSKRGGTLDFSTFQVCPLGWSYIGF